MKLSRCLHRPPHAAVALALAGILAISLSAAAQQPTDAQKSAIKQACRSDFMSQCRGVAPGGEAAVACLKANAAKLSPGCQNALRAVGGAAAAPAATTAMAPATVASPRAPRPGAAAGPTTWPHVIQGANGTATVYQPQVISWPDQKTLNTRIAVGITPNGAKDAAMGTIDVSFTTETSLATRTVGLSDARLAAARFPSVDAAQAAQFEERIRATLANMGPKHYPLDTVLASLPKGAPPAAAALKNEPPTIFVATGYASLVVFDGQPVLAPVTGTSLSFAVNTNWDVFFDADGGRWYLLINGGWLAATAVTGPWGVAGKLPAAFARLPGDANFVDVKKQIPGRTLAARDVPAVFVSTTPAEIIVTDGPPAYVPVPQTSLQYLTNSDAVVFRDAGDGRVYYLVSGRWFAAPSLSGPWTFATPSLPADFARIPADGPRGWVRASVPGTPEAQQAVQDAQIPQQASLDRSQAKLDVVYAGPPQFAPIPGTPLTYATNTSFDVIRVGDAYYACYQGAWFVAPTANGPWTLAAEVPGAIYAIPPESPLYRVTYVKVYAATPTYVTYGYTSGYTMAYVSSGVVVYGTGWYYPPYIYPAPIPIYYPYPYSYAGAVYYNPVTGAWARGGAIYGPYGGVAKAGTAYNPATGAWAHGGAVYGPNGGAAAVSAYNPSTGSYVHGSAAWGPNGGTANASWYNARTGVSGSTNQNSNAYGRWGSSTITGPNQTIHTQSQSNAQGSAGSFTSSSGAKGAGVSGAGGNSAGAVKTASGQVYAGADGNVYKKTDDGWEKYDNGSWNQVQKPASQQSGSTQQARQGEGQAQAAGRTSGTTPAREGTAQGQAGAQSRSGEGAGASRSEGFGQLEQDHQARTMGAERQQSWGGQRSGGRDFGGRGGGGGRRR